MNIGATRTYLDHNASTPLRPEAATAFVEALTFLGNPSSVHDEGRRARAAVETARDAVAALVGARARDVVFTGGGSEANATVLHPGFGRSGDPAAGARLLISAGEHASVRSGHRFDTHEVETLGLDARGLLDLDALRTALERADGHRPILSLHLANNETGVIQPVAEAAALVRAAGGVTHCDAVQAAGKIPVDLATLGVDALTLSAHKLGGPKGVGALVLRPGIAIAPLVAGGGQETGRRAGTENTAGIVAFGAAARLSAVDLAGEAVRLSTLRDLLEAGLRHLHPDLVVFGADAPRLPNTSAFASPGLSAQTLLIALDLAGIAVSSGSACSSGKVGRSHVLDAMGVAPDLAAGALRVSLGWTSSRNDVEIFLEAFEKTAASLYEKRRRAA